MNLLTIGLMIVGLVLLTVGADVFVNGASGIARRFNISPLIIGLTVVALGTSAPELAVNITAAMRNQPGVAVGNVLGSNTLNVLGILGLCAVFAPLAVSKQLIRLDVPIMIAAAGLLVLFSYNGVVGQLEGILLLGLLFTYTVVLIRIARRVGETKGEVPEIAPGKDRVLFHLLRILAGSAMLVLGSRWLVSSATEIARSLGVSELIIGLTVVAVGTSLPEVATSVIATLKGQREMAIGNVVGSNIYNILAVVGVTSVISKGGVPIPKAALHFDLPVMTAACLACLPIFFTGQRIDRWEGALFVAYYAAYILYLILDAQGHDILPFFSSVMLTFVLPLTLFTLIVLFLRSFREQRDS